MQASPALQAVRLLGRRRREPLLVAVPVKQKGHRAFLLQGERHGARRTSLPTVPKEKGATYRVDGDS